MPIPEYEPAHGSTFSGLFAGPAHSARSTGTRVECVAYRYVWDRISNAGGRSAAGRETGRGGDRRASDPGRSPAFETARRTLRGRGTARPHASQTRPAGPGEPGRKGPDSNQ